MELGKLAKFKVEYLKGYPIVNLKEEHFNIKEGYKLSAVVFNRPKGNEKQASAQIWVISRFGDIIEEKINLEFAYSEKDRITKALMPSSFKLRPEALQTGHARQILPEDIITPWEDVKIEKTIPRKTKSKNVWEITLVVEITQNDKKHEVSLLIDYTDTNALNALSITGTVEINLKKQEKVNDLELEDLDQINDFEINEEIVNGSPPSLPNKNIIKPAEHIRIMKLDYFPPESVDSREAGLKVEYFNRNSDQVVSKIIKLNFKRTIREAAKKLINSIPTTDFRYLANNRKTPPLTMDGSEFEYLGSIPGLYVIDTKYDYNQVGMKRRFIDVILILEYKTMFFKINKVVEFSWSKQEYIDGTFRTIKRENDSINFPKSFLVGSIIKRISEEDKALTMRLINEATIDKNYPYSTIKDIAISRFAEDSNLVIFAIKAIEKKGKDTIVHNFEKHVVIEKTYNEERLEKLTPEDIFINEDLLPTTPSVEISEQIFTLPDWCFFESMQFTQPELDTNEMDVQLKLKTGSAVVFLNKTIVFKKTIQEFRDFEYQLWEQDYLYNLSPSDILINLDVDGEPVDQINPSDIEGVPKGIDIEIKYTKPPVGKRATRVYISLIKGKAKVTFEQTLVFSKATAQEV